MAAGPEGQRRVSGHGVGCFFFQAEDGIRDGRVTGVQTCALPILLATEEGESRPDRAIDYLAVANETGAYQVTAHLADGHGYNGICFIAGPPDSPDSARRLDGFRRATAGLPETPVYHGDFTTAGGRRIAERIIAAGRVPGALVCANDQTAIGVMAALQQDGLSVPGDVAVTGFDGI